MSRSFALKFCQDRFGTLPDYPWERYPSYAVLRHRKSRKWYGVIMHLPYSKLGLCKEGCTDVMNVKVGPLLRFEQEGIYPAYHMNKSSWVSVVLDGTVPNETLSALLELSFSLT